MAGQNDSFETYPSIIFPFFISSIENKKISFYHKKILLYGLNLFFRLKDLEKENYISQFYTTQFK
jgi:hypothetical protein